MKLDDFTGRSALTVAASCVLLLAATVGALMMPAVRAWLGLRLAPIKTLSYAVGSRVDVPASLYDASTYTVVLFASDDCGYCQRAKPLFTTLTATIAAKPSFRMVMLAKAASDDNRAFAAAIGLDAAALVPIDTSTLRVQHVPTLLIVDRTGGIRYSAEGAWNGREQEALFETIASLDRPR